jgi:hypothetical protein
MPEFSFILTEHDASRPWVVLASEHRTVTLNDRAEFFAWAREQFPSPRWTVDLDPWQLSPEISR